MIEQILDSITSCPFLTNLAHNFTMYLVILRHIITRLEFYSNHHKETSVSLGLIVGEWHEILEHDSQTLELRKSLIGVNRHFVLVPECVPYLEYLMPYGCSLHE
jgi:hypothetical protein